MVKHRGIFKKKKTTWRNEEYLPRKIKININSMEDEESLLIQVTNGVGEMLYLCGFWSNMEEVAAQDPERNTYPRYSFTWLKMYYVCTVWYYCRCKVENAYEIDESGEKI